MNTCAYSFEFGQRIVDKARTCIGEKEDPAGSNRGELPDKVLRYVDVMVGQPWCAAFVSWICGTVLAADPFLTAYQTPITASSTEYRNELKIHGGLLIPRDVRPGDIGFVQHSRFASRFVHTFIVESTQEKPSGIWLAQTIEGNRDNSVMASSRFMIGVTFGRPYWFRSHAEKGPHD